MMRNIERDDEGFLCFSEDWDTELAGGIARELDIDMTEQHWEVVTWVRDDWKSNQSVPEARHVLKVLRERYGKDVATRKYLYTLFPYGYGHQACKIAGMRKPLTPMLEV